MTLNEQRSEQLDALKIQGVGTVKYKIQILNAAFKPWKTLEFDSMEEAVKAYKKMEPVYYGGFLRRCAEVVF